MRRIFFTLLGCVLTISVYAASDSLRSIGPYAASRFPFIHQLGFDLRTAYIAPTNRFLRGDNATRTPINKAFSAHLKYAFRFNPASYEGQVYRGAYQGAGLSFNSFQRPEELGTPIGIYLFQGGLIVRFNPHLSLNYEWNFGVSFGWKPHDYTDNPYNRVIGSRINAYLNANFYLDWELSPYWRMTAGADFTHYSNGNTNFPNAGLNTVGARIGLAYTLNPAKEADNPHSGFMPTRFQKHVSYDFILFGSWRRKGIMFDDNTGVASPDKYTVLGFNFMPLYNFCPRFRAGISLDGIYDSSASAYIKDEIVQVGESADLTIVRPPSRYQYALGLSARAEYVMPYFSVNVGIGANALYRSHDLRGCYQILALKISMTRSLFLHIGYNLQNFHNPNYLMLGIGYRFNNRRSIL